MKKKGIYLVILIFIFILSVFPLVGCKKEANSKENSKENFIGIWTCKNSISLLELQEGETEKQNNEQTEIEVFHEIHFQDQNKGMWKVSYEDKNLSTERLFDYQIDEDHIILNFADEPKEEYSFTFNQKGDELILNNKRNTFELNREK